MLIYLFYKSSANVPMWLIRTVQPFYYCGISDKIFLALMTIFLPVSSHFATDTPKSHVVNPTVWIFNTYLSLMLFVCGIKCNFKLSKNIHLFSLLRESWLLYCPIFKMSEDSCGSPVYNEAPSRLYFLFLALIFSIWPKHFFELQFFASKLMVLSH